MVGYEVNCPGLGVTVVAFRRDSEGRALSGADRRLISEAGRRSGLANSETICHILSRAACGRWHAIDRTLCGRAMYK